MMELTIKELVEHPLQLKETEIVEIQAKKFQPLLKSEEIEVSTKVRGEALDGKTGYSSIQVELMPVSGSFSLSVTVRGKFESEEMIEKQQLERFLVAQGVKILWSYIRQTLYDISGRILGNPYMLPTLDVVQTLAKSEMRDKEEDNGKTGHSCE